MFEIIHYDIERYLHIEYNKSSFIKRYIYLLFRQDLWAVIIFRFGKWVNYKCQIPLFCYFLKILYFFMRKFSEIILTIGIWPDSDIGPGLTLHYGGIYIKAKIGKDCFVSQQVTIGHIGGGKGGGVPTIGNNVYIGAGAKIMGDIKIGDNVRIGANAVVIKDVPTNSIAVGVPAHVKKLLK